MEQYGREVVLYEGPVTGRTWQLQGRGQHDHPVTLMRSPAGLFGTNLNVTRRSLPRSRRQQRVAVRPGALPLELTFDVHMPTPAETQRALMQFVSDWPDDGTPGVLRFNAGGGRWKALDVYRTDRIEDMIGIAPLAVGKAKIMIVASSDDPYPRGDYRPQVQKVAAAGTVTFTVRNDGEVAVAPRVVWQGAAATLTFGGAVAFTTKVTGDSLVDLDAEQLTVTDAATTRPLITSWDKSPALMVEPGGQATFTVGSTVAGTLEAHLVPQFERLY